MANYYNYQLPPTNIPPPPIRNAVPYHQITVPPPAITPPFSPQAVNYPIAYPPPFINTAFPPPTHNPVSVNFTTFPPPSVQTRPYYPVTSPSTSTSKSSSSSQYEEARNDKRKIKETEYYSKDAKYSSSKREESSRRKRSRSPPYQRSHSDRRYDSRGSDRDRRYKGRDVYESRKRRSPSVESRYSSSSYRSSRHDDRYSREGSSRSYRSERNRSRDRDSRYRTRSPKRADSSQSRSTISVRGVSVSVESSSLRRSGSAETRSRRSPVESIKSNSRDGCISGTEEYVFETIDKCEETDEEPMERWYRSSPADLFYEPVEGRRGVVTSTVRGRKLLEGVRERLVERGVRSRPPPGTEDVPPPRNQKLKMCKHKSEAASQSSECSSDSESDSDNDKVDHALQELQRKQKHPRRLHPELWYNDPGEMNDGPLCRCSARTRKQGIRHGIFAGEVRPPPCDPENNNIDKLYHYRITISPPTNFLLKTLTVIKHDEHEFLFSGFSLLSHYPLQKLPPCKVIRFNIEYTISYIEEQAPLNYTIEELDTFEEFLFRELLELVDLDFGVRDSEGCSQFHLLPRWEREVCGGGGEVLSMCEVMRHLLRGGGDLIPPSSLPTLRQANEREWQAFVDGVRGMIVTYPGKKPCSLRVDQLDRTLSDEDKKKLRESSRAKSGEDMLLYPEIVHFGIRPPQLSYAGNFEYKKAWRDYVKFRHLVANMAKPSYDDKRKLERKEAILQEMRTQSKMKRDVTVAVSAKGFFRTGLMCDVVQHAMLIPVLISHLRFHKSLQVLEESIEYKFQNRSLLQLALTHPSYRENYGTNRDHARNSLTNCGIRQPEYGDRRIHYMNIRKRGINTLINIMSRFGKKTETESAINHNERLEFLGDAVVEFISSIHLFRMFPSLEEGGLATYRAAIVQNQHLAQLAKKLGLEKYMLYAHGSDLCHDLELRHAMANCFEALMGALFLDGGIEVADRVFSIALWQDNEKHLCVWNRVRPHILQEQEPLGDRRWIPQYPFLQKLCQFEDSIGVRYRHIRLLARAFTDRSMGYTNLTLGSNQRLEFLGDTVLQLISSEYLYKHFPEHHEGHLSLLRSSLVNNRTQAIVCDDLAMTNYAVYHNPKAELKTKDKADLLEAFLGSLYIEKGLDACLLFCSICLFPRLREFIMNQEWNDPKSKLQQCCLTLRTMDGNEPDIPVYKVIECVGPTNTRVYTVAVYFRGERLASAKGHCIQEAEMNAAKAAIANSHNLFPQLDHQKRVIAKKLKNQRRRMRVNMKGREESQETGNTGGSSHVDNSENPSKILKQKISTKIDNLPRAYRLDNKRDLHSSDEDQSSADEKSDNQMSRDQREVHKDNKDETSPRASPISSPVPSPKSSPKASEEKKCKREKSPGELSTSDDSSDED